MYSTDESAILNPETCSATKALAHFHLHALEIPRRAPCPLGKGLTSRSSHAYALQQTSERFQRRKPSLTHPSLYRF